ncbi:hypothetical protein [Mycolicibacterium moriokaense]|uniref:hypothetical protein n=1 Tax=Mycolicibacterium moriokaense TaxID=39691 RepID=UPI0021F33775|nr:hypothetical protein [Mycolicibacterium moriokaense]
MDRGDGVDPRASCRGHTTIGGLGWPAVFPIGMYSSATYATAVETGWRWLVALSLVFFWVALAAWLVVAGDAFLRFRRARSRSR